MQIYHIIHIKRNISCSIIETAYNQEYGDLCADGAHNIKIIVDGKSHPIENDGRDLYVLYPVW